MVGSDTKKTGFKDKIRHGMIEYGINVIYLTLVFAAFTEYRRLILASHDIVYTDYGVAFIEAFILGKVIMIGAVFRLGRGLEEKPLIYPAIYKAVVFSIFVGVFKIIEHLIKVLWNGGGIAEGFVGLSESGALEVLANSLVVFVAFIPFFAVKELGRVMGAKKMRTLFFQSRDES